MNDPTRRRTSVLSVLVMTASIGSLVACGGGGSGGGRDTLAAAQTVQAFAIQTAEASGIPAPVVRAAQTAQVLGTPSPLVPVMQTAQALGTPVPALQTVQAESRPIPLPGTLATAVAPVRIMTPTPAR